MRHLYLFVLLFCAFLGAEQELEPEVIFVKSPRNISQFELSKGTVLKFSDNSTFTIDEFLGSGNTTRVYSVKEFPGKVLRIPKPAYRELNPTFFLNLMVESAPILEREGVLHTKVHKHLPFTYALVDRIPPNAISYQSFIYDMSIPKQQRQEMEDALFRDVKKYAYLANGDLGGKQMSYWPDSKAWGLNDWTRFGFRPPESLTDEIAEHSAETFFMDNDAPENISKKELNRGIAYERKLEAKYFKTLKAAFKELRNDATWPARLLEKNSPLSDNCLIIFHNTGRADVWRWKSDVDKMKRGRK